MRCWSVSVPFQTFNTVNLPFREKPSAPRTSAIPSWCFGRVVRSPLPWQNSSNWCPPPPKVSKKWDHVEFECFECITITSNPQYASCTSNFPKIHIWSPIGRLWQWTQVLLTIFMDSPLEIQKKMVAYLWYDTPNKRLQQTCIDFSTSAKYWSNTHNGSWYHYY